jgi:hypothetical protein
MRRWGPRLELALVFCVAAGLALHAGYRAAEAWEVNWEGLAAVAHAQDVLYRAPQPRLSEIGFVQPPLPSALAMLVAAPRTVGSAARFLPARLGALWLGLIGMLFFSLCRKWGLCRPLAYALTAVLIVHPVLLSQAAGGAPAALLTLLFLGILWGLDEWARSGSLRALLIASLLLGAALLTRYELCLWVMVIAALVAVIAARAGGYRQAEGTVLAFVLPIAYLAAGWIAACWFIQGDPWYFWRHTFTELPQVGAAEYLSAGARLSLLACGLLPGALWYLLWGRTSRQSVQFSLTLILGGPVLVAVAAPLLGRLAGDEWSQLTVPVSLALVGGFVMVAQAAVQGRGDRRWGVLVPTFVLFLAGSVAYGTLTEAGLGSPVGGLRAIRGEIAFTGNCLEESLAAQRLAGELAPGQRALIAGWPGFAVAMFEGDLARMTVLPTPEPLAGPAPVFDVLLTRETQPGDRQAAWEQACGRPLREVWRVGLWTAYRKS